MSEHSVSVRLLNNALEAVIGAAREVETDYTDLVDIVRDYLWSLDNGGDQDRPLASLRAWLVAEDEEYDDDE